MLYHERVLQGVRNWLSGVSRDGRFGYASWRKQVAGDASRLSNVEDAAMLVKGLRKLAATLTSLQPGASDAHEVRQLKRRCMDNLQALEAAASRTVEVP